MPARSKVRRRDGNSRPRPEEAAEAREAAGKAAGEGAVPETAGEGAGGDVDSDGDDGMGARSAACPTARGPPKPGGGPRARRDRPPDEVVDGPPVAGGDETTRGTCC